MSGTYSITVQEARGLVAVNADLDNLALVMGIASGGTGLKPFYASGQAAVAALGKGDAVDTLAQIIEQRTANGNGTKRPAAFYGLATTTQGACGAVDDSGVTGTSAITAEASVHPYGTYDAYIRVVNGGTIGTTGITFVWSLDGGVNESNITALGTAANYTIADGNVRFNFGTGTLVAGDIVRVRTSAPEPNTTAVANAFTALAAGSTNFTILVCDFICDATMFATIKTGRAALAAAGKRVIVLTRARLPDYENSETDAEWNADVAADFAALTDSGIHLRASYGLVTDAMTARQYLRSDLQQFAADVVRVRRATWPNCPNDQETANFSLVDADGNLVGHDEGVRGASTGLSNDSLGNRFGCVMRMADPTRMEYVYSTVPWVMYSTDERIRNLQTRRVVNAIERVAVAAGTTQLGGRFKYTPATGTTAAQLSDEARRAIHGIVFKALSAEFRDDISNANDAGLDNGLVQVAQSITVSGGNLLNVPITIAPRVFGYLLEIPITVAVQL